MPITIKEIISSDSMSGVIEKINFNFDQLILAGGGPPGIQGIQGIDGPIGPQGFRGDHWFTGPSAFGQTADHDGTSLRIQDHFIDESGEVYEYYNIVGATGWTASGINLKGPTGPEGAAGGSLEWKIYGGTFGNIVGATSYGPINELAVEPDPNLNFLIPNSTSKNSIFIGDQNWAYWNLRGLGTINNNTYTSDAVPKFTIIQNNVNTFGLNGLSFGGPLWEIDAPGGADKYGDSGATSIGGPTSSAYNFVNAAFMREQDTSTGDYITKWRLHSFRSNIKIKAGGNLTGNQPNYGYKPAMFEIEANRIRVYDYSKRKYIGLEPDVSFNYGFYLDSNDILKEIQINSPNDINRDRISGSSLSSNTYGYISLQNSQGAGTDDGEAFPEHRHGTVIIGPTYSTSQSIPLATDSYQGLAIVRKITRFDNTDAAIRFFQPNIQTGDANYVLANSRTLSQSGTITPVRTTEEAYNIKNQITGVVLDSLVINASNSNAGMSTMTLSTGVTAYNGGRLGLSNNPMIVTKPQFPIHLYAYPDFATRDIMWDETGVKESDRISNWYAGFDAREQTSNRNGGIAFGNTTWKDDYISVRRFSSTPTPQTFTNPIIKTYTRGDSSVSSSSYGSLDFIDFGLTPSYNQVLGNENPHIYMQPGIETSTGNIGIGFVPGSTSYNGTIGSISLGQISYAKSKLAVNGSVTVGSTHSGYHKYTNNVPTNGLLIGGLIVQGETQTQGLDTMKWNGPSMQGLSNSAQNFSYIPDDPVSRIQVGFATEKTIMAKRFLAKGSPSPIYPDFALPDAKTGMGRAAGEPGVGALLADRLSPFYNVNIMSNTVSPVMVAKWSSRGDGRSKNDDVRLGTTGVGGFTVTEAFALTPKYYDINTLPWYAVQVTPQSGGNTVSHRILYYEIPAKHSTVFLDLSDQRNNFRFFPNINNATLSDGTPTAYLNGFGPSGSSVVSPGMLANSTQFTIEDGYYEGQILRIMVLDVHLYNYSVLVPNAISRYTDYNTTPTPILVPKIVEKDNIVMAAEKWNGTSTTPSAASWPLSSPGGLETSQFTDQRPWPMPGNAKTAPLNIFPGTSAVTTLAIDAAIQNAINQYNTGQNTYWTDNSTGNYNPEGPLYQSLNGSHGVVVNSLGQMGEKAGIGAFKITPWRSITLQWHGDSYAGRKGCWYEIARENLVSRKTRAYSGSGTIQDLYLANQANNLNSITPNYTMMDIDRPTRRFSYSFYNPTGLGSLSLRWDGSGSINLNQTESGFIESSATIISSGSQITVPEQIGLDNYIEVRWKVISTDTRTNISQVLTDDVRTSTGPAIVYNPTTIYLFANWISISVEASVIIRKNTTLYANT